MQKKEEVSFLIVPLMLCQWKHKNFPFSLLLPPEAAKFLQNLCQKHKRFELQGGVSLGNFKNMSIEGGVRAFRGGRSV